jgi:hypothetical protein
VRLPRAERFTNVTLLDANAETAMSRTSHEIQHRYRRDGFAFPIDVLGPDQAQALLRDLETAEAELAGDAEKLNLLQAYPDRLLPSFDQLIRHPWLTALVSEILGP